MKDKFEGYRRKGKRKNIEKRKRDMIKGCTKYTKIRPK